MFFYEHYNKRGNSHLKIKVQNERISVIICSSMDNIRDDQQGHHDQWPAITLVASLSARMGGAPHMTNLIQNHH